jgi:hypothetical protein
MTSPTHPHARLKEAAIGALKDSGPSRVHGRYSVSMMVVLDDPPRVDNLHIRPEYAQEDLRYEIAEWDGTRLVKILGRVSSIDGAMALLDAEHRKAPRKSLMLREGARVIDRRGPDATP